jgi:hypothetical protein
MSPRPSRWIALAAALAAGAAGCDPPAVRTFVVVMEEPEYIDCFPVDAVLAADPNQVTNEFSYRVSSWRQNWNGGYLQRVDGTLQLVRQGDRTLAWFDELPGWYQQWNGLVLEGEPQDGYVQLGYDDPWDAQTAECADLNTSESELTATLEGGEIEGRIRRIEYTYFPSFDSGCAAHVECARNIAVYGTEQPGLSPSR